MDGIALTNLGGVGALPGLNLQFVMESLATVFLASLRVGAFLIASPFFGGTSVPLQPRIIIAVLLGVAVVSNVTVPSWQSFDAMTGFLVILTELAIGIGAGLILTIWFSSALLAVALAIGLAIGILQAATSIQEMTLTFVPKLILVVVAFGLLANFMMVQLSDYFAFIFDQVAQSA